MRSIYISVLLIMLSTCTVFAMSSAPIEEELQRVQGVIYEEGTGTISDFILMIEPNKRYLVKGYSDTKLRSLKNLPLILTGRLEEKEVSFVQGTFEIESYDVNNLAEGQYSILGVLKEGENNLVLLTRSKRIIHLEPTTYHFLANYVGKEVVINGELEESSSLEAKMRVKSYHIIEEE